MTVSKVRLPQYKIVTARQRWARRKLRAEVLAKVRKLENAGALELVAQLLDSLEQFA